MGDKLPNQNPTLLQTKLFQINFTVRDAKYLKMLEPFQIHLGTF